MSLTYTVWNVCTRFFSQAFPGKKSGLIHHTVLEKSRYLLLLTQAEVLEVLTLKKTAQEIFTSGRT